METEAVALAVTGSFTSQNILVLIRQGKLEFLNEGKPEPAGVGDVIYTASNRMHGLKNIGDTPALYFIVSVSHGQM